MGCVENQGQETVVKFDLSILLFPCGTMRRAMGPRARRLVYGSGFGALAFLLGWAITITVVPLEFAWPRGDPLKTGAWVWLAAHYMEITGGSLARFQQQNLAISVSNLPTLAALRAMPPVLTAFAAVLALDAISDSDSLLNVFLNSSSVLIGYLGLGLLAFLVFDARPAISDSVALVLFGSTGFLTLWVLIDALHLGAEHFGVAVAGWGLFLGVVFFAGGDPVVNALVPFGFVSLAGVMMGAVAMFGIRRYA